MKIQTYTPQEALIVFCFCLLIGLIASCSESKNQSQIQNTKIKDGYFEYDGGTWSSVEYRIEEKTIDGCEYIIVFGPQSRNIIHKANCENSFHTK